MVSSLTELLEGVDSTVMSVSPYLRVNVCSSFRYASSRPSAETSGRLLRLILPLSNPLAPRLPPAVDFLCCFATRPLPFKLLDGGLDLFAVCLRLLEGATGTAAVRVSVGDPYNRRVRLGNLGHADFIWFVRSHCSYVLTENGETPSFFPVSAQHKRSPSHEPFN